MSSLMQKSFREKQNKKTKAHGAQLTHLCEIANATDIMMLRN